MRIMEFKMERTGQIQIGDVVDIREGRLPSSYYYVIEPAVAMSGNFPVGERLKCLQGIVTDIVHTDKGFYVQVKFDES